MKKMYIQPTIETNSVHMDGTICAASGATGDSLNVSTQNFSEENQIL